MDVVHEFPFDTFWIESLNARKIGVKIRDSLETNKQKQILAVTIFDKYFSWNSQTLSRLKKTEN